MTDSCDRLLKHLNRIQGQITALKGYISDERACEDVAHLLSSITTSFASVRSEIVEEMLMRELGTAAGSTVERGKVRSIVSVLKK